MVLRRLRPHEAQAGNIGSGPGEMRTDPGVDGETIQRALATGVRYELGLDSFFGASHSMRPDGERHTHSFRVQASIVTDRVDRDGMVVGFREVSNLLEDEAKSYANRYLNEMPLFDVIQPTGENLATVILRNLDAAMAETMPEGVTLVAVTLWENPTSWVRVQLLEVPDANSRYLRRFRGVHPVLGDAPGG